jgi:hypothetical protein
VPPSAAFWTQALEEATPFASEHNVIDVSFIPKRRETASERFAQRVAKIRARGRPRFFLEELAATFESASGPKAALSSKCCATSTSVSP